ncbi:hypothetical protein Ct9H90mP12_0860 [bacterium]|nr:MAG: hypothetical protein Ct9H90mP12_0860 [bacterium]
MESYYFTGASMDRCIIGPLSLEANLVRNLNPHSRGKTSLQGFGVYFDPEGLLSPSLQLAP